MTLINFFCIGAPGFVLGLEPNNARVKGAFLSNVLKRALPASIAVILAVALDIFVTRVFGFSSSRCLRCAAYVVRGERQPNLAHLAASHALTCGALCVCSRRHPGGRYRIPGAAVYCQPVDGQMVILAVIVVFTCSVFFKLATMMDSLKPRRRHAATGFGRGVRVRLGRGGGKVSSTGSTAERFCQARRRRHGAAPRRSHRSRGRGPRTRGRGPGPAQEKEEYRSQALSRDQVRPRHQSLDAKQKEEVTTRPADVELVPCSCGAVAMLCSNLDCLNCFERRMP